MKRPSQSPSKKYKIKTAEKTKSASKYTEVINNSKTIKATPKKNN